MERFVVKMERFVVKRETYALRPFGREFNRNMLSHSLTKTKGRSSNVTVVTHTVEKVHNIT